MGLVVNKEKSKFVATQRLVNIRVEYHLDVSLISPYGQDLEDRELHPTVSDSQSDNCSLVAITTRFTKFSDAIPLVRLHLRRLQIRLMARWALTSKDLKALIPVKLDLLHNHLQWWQNRPFTRAGMFLDLPDPQTHLFTDASTTGWGAHLETTYTL